MTIEKSLLALQGTMLNALTSNVPLAQTMYMLCCEVERLAPELHVCILRLDGQLMRPLASPSMPDNYDAALDGLAIGPHVGACGVSMTYGRSVLTTDIATDPNWAALKHVVMPLGLRACWSHPIKARDGKVLGSMAFYYTAGGQPTEFHHQLAENCVNLCSLAFEHEATQQSLQRHAYFDDLTGLPNRAMLNREAQRTLVDCERNGKKFSLLFIDLDNLKPINDALGHMVGDVVLQRAAECFRSCMRNGDFVGRLGGDEFLAVVHHGDVVDIQEAAARLLRSFRQPLDLTPIRREKIQISVSIGVAVYPEDGMQVEMLLEQADKAMYQAKAAGRNRIQFVGGTKLEVAAATPPAEGGAAAEAAVINKNELILYGEEVQEPMTRLSLAIKPLLGGIVDRFYEQIPRVSGASYLISHLSADELGQLKIRLMDDLILLCSPDLDSVRHEETALHVGQIHVQTGLTRDALASSYSLLSALVRANVDAKTHEHALAILGQRMLQDLMWQLIVAQQVQLLYSAILTKITDLAWKARSYTELISSAAAIIGTLTGVAGCAFLRLDSRQVFQVEAVAGAGMAEFYGEIVQRQLGGIADGSKTFGVTPPAWAWNSRVVERCFNFQTDVRMAAWRPFVEKWGLRSSMAIPLVSPKEQSVSSILSVHSRLPGGFSSQEQDMFFSQIQSLLVFGINRLRAWRIASEAVPFSTRERWAHLLKTGGLEMYYQPIMDLKTGRISKVEALARLHDGAQVLVPEAFFTALSQKDFLLLYENGLNQVLEQRGKWVGQGLELDVAINLPNAALEDELYVDITARTLLRYNCPPAALTLEILEADAVSQDVDLFRVLDRYKGLGLHLAEDDLGAGYSTLARLREMPFDVIKIDRSIVSQVENDPYNTLCFIYQLTRLGHDLGGKVIVEGIESVDLLEACVILGVDCAQGYAVARPMSGQALEAWIERPLELPSAVRKTLMTSRLALLANVLVWEESWHLLAKVSQSGYKDKKGLTRSLEQAVLDEGFPLPGIYAEARQELVECVTRSGLYSDEYLRARARMVALLRDPETLDC